MEISAETIARELGYGREYHNSSGWWTWCPVHEASGHHETPSLNLTERNGQILAYCQSKHCPNDEIIAALRKRNLWPGSNGTSNNGAPPKTKRKPLGPIVKTYDYRDEHGTLIHQTTRHEPKDFRQRRPCPNRDGGGCGKCDQGWIWNLQGVQTVLYRLPDLVLHPAELTILCEGEKDADNAGELGFLTTTNAQGAKVWKPQYNSYFANRPVIIAADRDSAGENRVLILGRNLREYAQSICVLRLPGGLKTDLSDWIDAGRVAGKTNETLRTELLALIEQAPQWREPAAGQTAPDEQIRAPQWSEDDIALQFVDACGEDWRYVARTGTWYHWTGNHWREDSTELDYQTLRLHSRGLASRAQFVKGGDAIAKRLSSARHIGAVERIVRADSRIATVFDTFDANLDILNTPAGVISLLDGSTRENRREDYCNKITSIAAAQSPDCPVWRELLERVQPDEEVRAYLQRVLGYALTGRTMAQALFFFYGTGNNGKSTILNTLVEICGSYAKTVESRLFMESKQERHPTEIARLMGARVIVANEIKRGREWDESLITEITGGTPVSGRFMFSNFIEFIPQLKPFIAGNHKPTLRGINVAMRRRFHLIPFSVRIPDKEVDRRFQERLRPEYAGILRWMVEGCLVWREMGLAPPKGIVEATSEYFAGEDVLADFIARCCKQDLNAQVGSTMLFQAWKQFTETRNEYTGSQKAFSQMLREKGYTIAHTNAGSVVKGLCLWGNDSPEDNNRNNDGNRRYDDNCSN